VRRPQEGSLGPYRLRALAGDRAVEPRVHARLQQLGQQVHPIGLLVVLAVVLCMCLEGAVKSTSKGAELDPRSSYP